MKTFSKSFVFLLMFFVCNILFSSCKKGEEPVPLMGTLLTYTNIPKSEFDRIDVIVDGKVAASITEPYGTVKPVCGATNSASAAVVALTPGVHKVYAIQYKGGKNVGEWEPADESITADKCKLINWTE